jgi:aspartate 4-decarboxylase
MNDMIDYAKFETLSPFEIKDALIKLARAEADKSSAMFLNAGRGNPNWIATRAREAFFLLGQFALTESKRVFEDDPNGLAGMPARDGCYNRFVSWVERRKGDADTPGAETLLGAVDFAIQKFGFDADAFVHELTDSIIGDNYPVPDRALVHNEMVTHEYLMWAMCHGHRPPRDSTSIRSRAARPPCATSSRP